MLSLPVSVLVLCLRRHFERGGGRGNWELHGPDLIYRTRWGEWRTRVRRGRCVFLKDNVCTIHAQSYYPAVCRGFPWIDAETGGPYEYDRTICPEFILRPELVELKAGAKT